MKTIIGKGSRPKPYHAYPKHIKNYHKKKSFFLKILGCQIIKIYGKILWTLQNMVISYFHTNHEFELYVIIDFIQGNENIFLNKHF